jgi:hypothetical protein
MIRTVELTDLVTFILALEMIMSVFVLLTTAAVCMAIHLLESICFATNSVRS